MSMVYTSDASRIPVDVEFQVQKQVEGVDLTPRLLSCVRMLVSPPLLRDGSTVPFSKLGPSGAFSPNPGLPISATTHCPSCFFSYLSLLNPPPARHFFILLSFPQIGRLPLEPLRLHCGASKPTFHVTMGATSRSLACLTYFYS